jgi:hypothetical protein
MRATVFAALAAAACTRGGTRKTRTTGKTGTGV